MQQWHNAPVKQILQIALTAQILSPSVSNPMLAGIADKYGGFPLIRDAILSSLQDHEFALMQYVWKAQQWQTREPSKEIFLEMLATAIIRKKDATEISNLLVMLDRKGQSVDWREKAVLTGLSMGGASNTSKLVRLATEPGIFKKSSGKIGASCMAKLASLFEWPGHTPDKTISTQKTLLNEEQQQLFTLGRQHFLTTCAGCHGTDGAGMRRFAPPLMGSDWVLGDDRRLALIVLHGMEGPVEVAGKKYDAPEILPVMPAHSTMDDAAITAILTYIRNEWGNNAGPIGNGTVGTTRNTTQGRVVPWKAEELKKYAIEKNVPESK